ncbi:MAG: hypothetical protein PHU45_04925 [Bacilli bacterium]|nr:hypothetical protein [Bacilli bacterium]
MLICTQFIHFNFENGEIFFYKIDNTAIKYDPKELKKEEKELEDFFKEAKNTIFSYA